MITRSMMCYNETTLHQLRNQPLAALPLQLSRLASRDPAMRRSRTKGWLDDSHITELLRLASPPEALAISLFADAGCRLREALSFDVSSLSGSGLRIWGSKGKRWRTVPVPDRLAAAIAAALSLQATTGAAAPILASARTIQRRLIELCHAAGAPLTTPHRLRHSYATRLHAEGVPLATISALLGHRNIATTLKYLHVGETDYDRAKVALDRRARRARPKR
jgi:integrase